MEPIDAHYLTLQFQNRIYKVAGNSFQGLFEEIMEKASRDFQKIRPYGNMGDGGNDGFQPREGIYYQVYAPLKPNEKESAAAAKLKKDFEKLQKTWNQISEIKIFYFVFNDKYAGTSLPIEQALAELKKSCPWIEFKGFFAKDLEKVFLGLSAEQILALGFDINQTKALLLAQESLEIAESYVDRDNGDVALTILGQFKELVSGLNNEELSIRAEILIGKSLERLERMKEAAETYQHLCVQYPSNPQAYLYLASIYLQQENPEKNLELLKKAEAINPDYWFLTIQKLLRALRLNEQVNVSQINEQTFPEEFRAKSTFYRIYSIFLAQSGDTEKALKFITKAISINPERITNYIAKISTLETIAFSHATVNREQSKANVVILLSEIEAIQQRIAEYGGCTPRNIVVIEYKKMRALFALESYPDAIQSAQEFIKQVSKCYFDYVVDRLLSDLITHIQVSPQEFDALLQRLQKEEKPISDDLSKALLLQFSRRKLLFTEGKKFFAALKAKEKVINFIEKLEANDFNAAWEFLKEDMRFAVVMATSAKDLPDLRKAIIERLPNDGNIQKEKLQLLLDYDQKHIDEAFELLKQMNFSEIGYLECKPILDIVQKKEAWDFEIKILEKLLKTERNPEIVSHLKLQLLSANLKLKRLPEAIRIGEELLPLSPETNTITEGTREEILAQILLARLNRGEFSKAKALLLKHQNYSKTFGFKVAVEAEVYVKNGEGESALASIVAAVKVLKTPTPEQYGSLILTLTNISNLSGLRLESLPKSEENCFVKVKTIDRWYFLGDSDELDATKIAKDDDNYSGFLGKKVCEKIVFKHKYQSNHLELEIENILPIEKYILWQSHYHAHKLSTEHRWTAMEIIEVPAIGDTIDPKFIIARLEDEQKPREDFFKLYCTDNIPLAFLGLNEGGLANALGHIVAAGKGFVKFSSGLPAEMEQQVVIARQIIEGRECFLDGTSALILAESGIGEKIFGYLPNLKIPQTVVSMLFEIKEKYRYTPGQVGHMGYVNGKIRISSIDPDRRVLILKNFERYIANFESKPQNICAISSATKQSHFTEQSILPELSDACALSRVSNAIVITEDFLYLKANELDTKLQAPAYCSTFAVVKTLYSLGKISFEEYFSFFSYLAFYRFKFLPISVEDIDKAVFGDAQVKVFQPERIRQLNFPLTLSEEYGVHPDIAFRLIVGFFLRAVTGVGVSPDMVEKLFAEILAVFPTQKSKKELALNIVYALEYLTTKILRGREMPTHAKDKLVRLSQFAEIYTGKEFLAP